MATSFYPDSFPKTLGAPLTCDKGLGGDETSADFALVVFFIEKFAVVANRLPVKLRVFVH